MKSKFLKKSLAVLVAATMAFATLPMFAGAAGAQTLGLTDAAKARGGSVGDQATYEANMKKITNVAVKGDTVEVTTNGPLTAYQADTGTKPEQPFFGLLVNLGITGDEKNYVTFAENGGYTSDLDGSLSTANQYTAAKNYGGTGDGDMILWLPGNKNTSITFNYAPGGVASETDLNGNEVSLVQTKTIHVKVIDSTKVVDPGDPVDPIVPETPVQVAPNPAVTVTPVIKGLDPEIAKTLTLNVTEAKKDEGNGKIAFEAAAKNGQVLGFYEIKLTNPDGSAFVLGEGESLKLTFELGKEFANQKLVIRHYNSETGKFVKEYAVTADENGVVTIEVTELSFFAVQKAPAESGNPKTGDMTQPFVLLSVLALTGAAVVVLRKRQLAK